MNGMVYFCEHNIRGGWTVYGLNGVKQYYGCSKAQAVRAYIATAKQEIYVREEPVRKPSVKIIRKG